MFQLVGFSPGFWKRSQAGSQRLPVADQRILQVFGFSILRHKFFDHLTARKIRLVFIVLSLDGIEIQTSKKMLVSGLIERTGGFTLDCFTFAWDTPYMYDE